MSDSLPDSKTSIDAFLRNLQAKNRSQATILAYQGDLTRFFSWLTQNNATVSSIGQVKREDVTEYLASLGADGLTGVSRARKLAAIREFFRYAEDIGSIPRSPVTGIETPKKEKSTPTYLTPEEYRAMLSLAGASSRDYAILQVFLQTGIRVSELSGLKVSDIDLEARSLRVTAGKGMTTRDIELEKKGVQALKSYLAIRPQVLDEHLFLNQYGEPISERGVQKLVTKYRRLAGIHKRAGCHSLRHTFATYKAEKGVSPFQLKEWLGHANLNTTQIYVHLARQNAKKVMEATSL